MAPREAEDGPRRLVSVNFFPRFAHLIIGVLTVLTKILKIFFEELRHNNVETNQVNPTSQEHHEIPAAPLHPPLSSSPPPLPHPIATCNQSRRGAYQDCKPPFPAAPNSPHNIHSSKQRKNGRSFLTVIPFPPAFMFVSI